MKKTIIAAIVLMGLSGGIYAENAINQLKVANGSNEVAPVPAGISVRANTVHAKYECTGSLEAVTVPLTTIDGITSSAFIRPFQLDAVEVGGYLMLTIFNRANNAISTKSAAPMQKKGLIATLSLETTSGFINLTCSAVN